MAGGRGKEGQGGGGCKGGRGGRELDIGNKHGTGGVCSSEAWMTSAKHVTADGITCATPSY